MSQSAEEARKELEDALKYGRCRICDGMLAQGYPKTCKCCTNCWNAESECVCCPYCRDDLGSCHCTPRIAKIWDHFHRCDNCLEGAHQAGEQCTYCCAYCKQLEHDCKCCKKCGTTPCICCTRCRDLRIKCKCWGAKVLWHFMRRTNLYHKNQQELLQFNFPANTAVLITVKNSDE